MQYSHIAIPGIIWMSPATAADGAMFNGWRQRAARDRRWPAMLRKLRDLHKHGRRAIRIVDTACGTGELLMLAARRARELGFVAIEGRGVDRDPSLIARARRLMVCQADPAIGLTFDQGQPADAMRDEAEFPADLLLCPDRTRQDGGLRALARSAGRTLFWDGRSRADKGAA